MEIKTRLLAVILTMALIVTSGPVQVFAYGAGEVQSVEADAEDQKLTAEIEGDCYIVEDDSVSNDELYQGYVESLLYPEQQSVWAVHNKLTGVNLNIFNKLKEKITSTAKGQQTSTKYYVTPSEAGFSKTIWTAEELGVDNVVKNNQITEEALNALYEKLGINLSEIVKTLLADCPYELYWFDKTMPVIGPVCSISAFGNALGIDGLIEFHFPVASDYAKDTYVFDTEKIAGVENAIANAEKIISTYSRSTDYEKVEGYRKEICDLVSYDGKASSEPVSCGDPWQIINVFDGDNDTNVVCEGYAKAFQYLCDNSDFKSESINCISVTGTMMSQSQSGGHMWNIMTMDDEKNYLVDVTNCDEGTIGVETQLFLKGCSEGDVATGYTYSCNGGDVRFLYDSDATSIYDSSELELSTESYVPTEIVESSGTCGENAVWTFDGRHKLTISGSGEITDYTDITDTRGWNPFLEDITTLVIEEGITSTGSYAFTDLPSLEEVTFPSTMKKLAKKAFDYNETVERVNIADIKAWCQMEIPSYSSEFACLPLSENGADVYLNGELITELIIPSEVNAVPNFAFSHWRSLKKVTLEEGVTTLGDNCFANCTSLKEVYIPDTITKFGYCVFYGCTSLTELTLPNSLQEARYCADKTMPLTKLTQPISLIGTFMTYDVPSTLTNFVFTAGNGTGVDYNNGDMTDSNRKHYKFTPWYYNRNKSLTITLEEGIEHIGNYMFKDCAALTELTIPLSVTSIGTEAIDSTVKLYVYEGSYGESFAQANGNTYEIIHRYEKTFEEDSTCFEMGYRKYTCTVCEKSYYEDIPIKEHVWGDAVFTMKDGTELKHCLLCNHMNSETGALLRSIKDYSTGSYTCVNEFEGHVVMIVVCEGEMLEDASYWDTLNIDTCFIAPGVTKLPDNAFKNCTSIEEIVIPDTVLDIGSNAFSGCSSSLNIYLDENNPKYKMDDGLLMDAEKTRVLHCHGSNRDVILEDSVLALDDDVFSHLSEDATISLPFDMDIFREADTFGNATLNVYENSYGRRFAETNNLPWISRGKYRLPWSDEEVHHQMAFHMLVQHLKGKTSNQVSISLGNIDTTTKYTIKATYTDGKVQMMLIGVPNSSTNVQYYTYFYLDENGIVNNQIVTECQLNGSTDNGYTGLLTIDAKDIKYGKTRLWTITPGRYMSSSALNKPSCIVLANNHLDTLLLNAGISLLQPIELYVTDLGFTQFFANSEGTIHLNVSKSGAVATGCTTSGKEADSTCSICGAYKEGQVLEATGHNWDSDYTVDKAASCTEEGFKSIHCSACDATMNTTVINKTAHTYGEWIIDKAATCTDAGSKHRKCTNCDVTEKETVEATGHTPGAAATCTTSQKCTLCEATLANATGHTYKEEVTIATLSSNGKIEKKCSKCGEVELTTPIYRPTKFTLSTTAYTYDGKIKKPTVTVKNSAGKTLVKDTDYTLTYASGRKYVGKYSVKITFEGKYSGSKTLYFNINPPKTSLTSLTASSKGFTAKWSKKTTQVTGYQIQYSTSSKFTNPKTVTITKNSITYKKITKLLAKKRYYVRVRTYKTVGKTWYYSSWSGYKYVTTKA